MKRLDLLYFAWVREQVGKGQETLDVPADVATVSDLFGWLAKRGPGYEVFGEVARLRCAVDQTFCAPSMSLSGAHEVAIFPPVTGG